MNKSFRLAMLCFGLPLTAILFAFSFQPVAVAQQAETVNLTAPTAVCGQFGLKNLSYYRIPRAASTLVSADFNNDGILDIVAPMSDTNSIAVVLGNNQKGFADAREFNAGVSPQYAAVGDFNRDGELDLAVASKTDQSVNILLGDGTGNFTLTDSYAVGRTPRKVVAADFNNDLWLDLAIANTESSSISIFLGGANGFTESAPAAISLNTNPQTFEVGDFNRDGKLDLIVLASSVRLLYGNGQGAFMEALTVTVAETYSLAIADFNNDNYPDFATAGYRENKLRVYLNNRSGNFNAPLETELFNSWLPLFAGDFNGDGKIDLTGNGSILLNDGTGNFTVLQGVQVPNGEIAIADFNGDGTLDFASTGGVSNFSENDSYSTFTVYYNHGDFKFDAPTYLSRHSNATSNVVADFNNDGRLDVASAIGFPTGVQVSTQNEDGTFSLVTPAPFAGSGGNSQRPTLTGGDFNNDGKIDLAAALGGFYVYLFINDGTARFTTTLVRLVNPPNAHQALFITSGDFNNDGKLDLVALSESQYFILLNNGNGEFTISEPVSMNTLYEIETVKVGDFDGDGKKDLAISRGDLSLWMLKGKGDGTFTSLAVFPMPFYVGTVRAEDVNGDNKDDLFVAPYGDLIAGTPNFVTLFSNAAGGFTQNNILLPGLPSDIAFGDFNGDAVKDYLITNSPTNAVTLFAGNGNGTFTAQPPINTFYNPPRGSAVAADFNRDQKLDLVIGSNLGNTAVFYNNLPTSPCLSVNDIQVTEGDGGTTDAQFTVTLSAAAQQKVNVDYRVVGRSARENSDYNVVSGQLEFAPGIVSKTIAVPVRGDAADEINETFQVVLFNAVGAALTDNIGVATIADNDAAPSLGINDVSIVEGSSGNPAQLIFNAMLSAPTGRKAKVEFTTIDGTATAGSDFKAAAGTIVFNDGESAKQIVVEINPDFFVEPDETFKIKLSNSSELTVADDEITATITNDDVGGIVQFETTVVETNEANDAIIVRVARSGGNASGIILDYATADGTAKANRDYLPSSGRIIFGANETEKTFTIPILDDAIDESSIETVNLTLSGISGGAALGGQSTAVLNIADDDAAPAIIVAESRINEGNSGATMIDFTVRLLAVSEQIVRVNFATADGTATAPQDYSSVTGSLVFAPGETSKTVAVGIQGDTNIEPDETFSLKLDSPSNAVLQNMQAVGTIVNDDSNTRRSAAISDFDGDGKTDIAVFRPTGFWFYSQSSDDAFKAVQFGKVGDRLAPGDYDGDGKADVAVYRPEQGAWYILESRTSAFRAVQWGVAEDKPVAGDYDGDTKTDVAVYRPSTRSWYILRSSDSSFTAVQWGVSEDKPVPADYDGDGKADVAVFRPSNGNWYRLNSSDNQLVAFHFGVSEDKPVPADYDGDGKADVAVYRPSSGSWYVQQSAAGFTGFRWGVAADQPAPGDYDGDGKADFVVFRSENGNWYLNQTSGTQRAVHFGAVTDIAVSTGYFPN